jgi:hypothetical protein
MSVAETAAPHFELDRVVRRAFSVIKNNLLVFALLSLLAAIPSAALTWAQPATGAGFFDLTAITLTAATWLVYVVSMFVLQAALVHGTVADLNGRRASFADCLSTGLKHFMSLLLIALGYFFAVFIGLIFFVVPGIIVAVMLSVAVPVRVVEDAPVMVAFNRSQELTKGHRWAIFGLFVAYYIVQMIISMIVLSVVVFSVMRSPDAIAIAAGTAKTWPVIAASAVAQMINAILSATGTASIYYELRQIKEGVGPEALASVFD